MLDAFIIEEIKRREQNRQENERPVVELPVPSPEDHPKRKGEEEEEKPQRGVVVIDLLG